MKRYLLLSLIIHIIILNSFKSNFNISNIKNSKTKDVKIRIIKLKSNDIADISIKENKKELKKESIISKSIKTKEKFEKKKADKKTVQKELKPIKKEKEVKITSTKPEIKKLTINNNEKTKPIEIVIPKKTIPSKIVSNKTENETKKSIIKKKEEDIENKIINKDITSSIKDKPLNRASKIQNLTDPKNIKKENRSKKNPYIKLEKNGSLLVSDYKKLGLKPKLISYNKLKYPKKASRVKLKKDVKLQCHFILNEDGTVSDIKINSDYDKYINLGFYSEAKKVISSFKFNPVTYNGKRVKILLKKTFTFRSPYK